MKPATLLKITLLHGCFSRFLNCTNSTKLRQASHTSFEWKSFDRKFDYSHGKYFEGFLGLGSTSRPFLIYYRKFAFSLFLKCTLRPSKIVNINGLYYT